MSPSHRSRPSSVKATRGSVSTSVYIERLNTKTPAPSPVVHKRSTGMSWFGWFATFIDMLHNLWLQTVLNDYRRHH